MIPRQAVFSMFFCEADYIADANATQEDAISFHYI